MRRRNPLSRLLELVFAGLIVLVVLAPVFWLLSVSLRPTEETFRFPLTVLPERWTLQAYREVWLSAGFSNDWLRYLFNTMLVAFGVSALTALIGLLVGYVLSRMRGASGQLFRSFFIFVQLLEGPVLLVPIYVILATLGLVNSLWGYGLVLFVLFLPFTATLSYGFARNIPIEIDEAARIDGCTPWQTFRLVYFPMARIGFVTVLLMTFLLAWGEYTFAIALLDGGNRTVSTAMTDLVTGLNVYWNQMAAAAVIVSIPVIVVLVFAQRHIVGGLTGGAIK